MTPCIDLPLTGPLLYAVFITAFVLPHLLLSSLHYADRCLVHSIKYYAFSLKNASDVSQSKWSDPWLSFNTCLLLDQICAKSSAPGIESFSMYHNYIDFIRKQPPGYDHYDDVTGNEITLYKNDGGCKFFFFKLFGET